MTMMWMRMPGQTWIVSATSFLLMWLAMMVAMMLPSVFPMFVKIGEELVQKWCRNVRLVHDRGKLGQNVAVHKFCK